MKGTKSPEKFKNNINFVIYLKWRMVGRVEIFRSLQAMLRKYPNGELGISKYAIYKKNLEDGYYNSSVEIRRYELLKY